MAHLRAYDSFQTKKSIEQKRRAKEKSLSKKDEKVSEFIIDSSDDYGTVIEVRYRAPFQTPYYSAETKSWGYITHPEDYSTFIKCNETIYNLDSKEAYILCKDRVKEEILVEYIMLYFEDGKIETYVEVGGFR